MSTFSITANHFSKEDEERELNELTEAEKEVILNDKYGRIIRNRNNSNNSNNNNNNGNGNGDGGNADDDDEQEQNDNNENDHGENNDDNNIIISDELLNEFHRAKETLPLEIGEYLWMALFEDENLVNGESGPEYFLRCEDYNPERAAYRQGEYWKLRYEIFGEVDAVKPLTLDDNGAMKSVVPYMVQIPNLLRILPNDDNGRTVICFDRTGMSFNEFDDIVLVKIIWFVLHKGLEREETHQNGVVLIIIDKVLKWDFPSYKLIKLCERITRAVPIIIHCRQCCLSPLIKTLVTPAARYIATRYDRLRAEIHDGIDQHKTLNKLETFGLQRTNLPTSIGGSYDEKPLWIQESERIVKKKKRSYRDVRNGYF